MKGLKTVIALTLVTTVRVCANAAGPVYPVYAIVSGSVAPTRADIDVLAKNFDLAQGSFSTETIDAIHEVNPEFKAVRYFNSTYTAGTDDVRLVESKYRHALTMFVVATLKEDIGRTTTRFRLTPSKKGDIISLRASTTDGALSAAGPSPPNTKKYVTWIRIGDELMRIDIFDRDSGRIEVTRAFDGTQAGTHQSGAKVFSPVYLGSVNETGAWPGGPGAYLRYAFDPANPAGIQWQLHEMIDIFSQGYNGFWLDICSASPFNMSDSDGRHVTPWDFRTGRPYDKNAYCIGQQIKVDAIQTAIFKKFGKWPTMIANNMKARTFEPGKGGQRFMLVPTDVKPRPLDGYCIENYAGGFPARAADRAKYVGPRYHDVDHWRANQMMLMECAQNGLAAYPMIANAGFKSLMLENLGSVRDKFESFAYASYLLCVEKDGSTKLGLPAFYQKNGRRFAKLHPRYTWPIGPPVEIVKPERIDDYKIKGHSTYTRRFRNGLVLVNPADTDDTQIKLDQQYIDPDIKKRITRITMKANSGKILLGT